MFIRVLQKQQDEIAMAMCERPQVVGATRHGDAQKESDLVLRLFGQGPDWSRGHRGLRRPLGRRALLTDGARDAPRGAVALCRRAPFQGDTEQCEIRTLVSDVLEGAAAGNFSEEQQKRVGKKERASGGELTGADG